MTIHFCMPFWGDPSDLRAAVESVLSQDDPDWLLTVIDDCYPDETVEAYFVTIKDARVEYVRNERNVGIIENFRRCVRAARAPYVVILGSDDLLESDYVSSMRQIAAQRPDVAVFQPGVRVIGADGRPRRTLVDFVKQSILTPRRARTMRGEEMAASLLVGDWLYWPSLMFRVEALRSVDFREDLPIILDLALLVDLAFAGAALHYDPKATFRYRRHDKSLSQTTILDGTRFDDERDYYRETAAAADAKGWKRARRAARWRVMSRLHGVVVLPTVVLKGNARARRAALRLALAR